MTSVSIDYLAAFFDREGTIIGVIDSRELNCGVRPARLSIRVGTSKKLERDLFKDYFDFGVLYKDSRSTSDNNLSDIWYWEANGDDAAVALEEMKDHLIGKKYEAELGIELQNLIGSCGKEVDEETAKKRLELAHKICDEKTYSAYRSS